MKKEYLTPTFEAEKLEIRDVITTSSEDPGFEIGDED